MRKFDPPPRGGDPRYRKAREALLVLGAVAAENADYAKNKNGRGFSRSDSSKGHALAALGVVTVILDPSTYAEVHSMSAGYRRQAARIARQAISEKAKREKLAAKRDKLRVSGWPAGQARWAASNSNNKPSIFFGEISGMKGYWQSPQARGAKLRMLVRFSDDAPYKSTFRWDDTVSAADSNSDPATL